jgi:hypothetical protein
MWMKPVRAARPLVDLPIDGVVAEGGAFAGSPGGAFVDGGPQVARRRRGQKPHWPEKSCSVRARRTAMRPLRRESDRQAVSA